MGDLFSKPPPPGPEEPWRQIHDPDFKQTAEYLKSKIACHRDTQFNIVVIGHTGAGKSSFINAIFSISRGRITSMATVKSDDVSGVGTYHFSDFKSTSSDLFQNVSVFDTMGFTGRIGEDDKGIKMEDLKAVCEGRVPRGHRFNTDVTVNKMMKNIRPHCVIFVVSAEEVKHWNPYNDNILQKMRSLFNVVPNDIARIAVLTKVDRICDDTNRDIQNIYKSSKIRSSVKKVQNIFGVQENEVFPVVNFVTDMEVKPEKSVPLLYAIKFALDYAYDRNRDDKSDLQTLLLLLAIVLPCIIAVYVFSQ